MPELLHEHEALSVLLPSFEAGADPDMVADAWEHLAEWLDYEPEDPGASQPMCCFVLLSSSLALCDLSSFFEGMYLPEVAILTFLPLL